MDDPFLPALIAFSPLFAVLMYQGLIRRGQERKKVPRVQIAIAISISLVIGVAGVAVSYFLS